jgi:RNA polymerase sigma factor (sigma-70 family)
MRDFGEMWASRRRDVERLARAIARRDDATFDALVAAGQEALWRASTSYDESRRSPGGIPVSFWSYARRRVMGAMVDELRQSDHLARPARMASKGRAPAESWALVDRGSMAEVDHLPHSSDPEAEASLRQSALLLEASLSPREQIVLERVVVGGELGCEIAGELGISAGRVSQIARAAVAKLRSAVKIGS